MPLPLRSLLYRWTNGAYVTEIVRGGIESIDPGQMRAASSLGMPYALACDALSCAGASARAGANHK